MKWAKDFIEEYNCFIILIQLCRIYLWNAQFIEIQVLSKSSREFVGECKDSAPNDLFSMHPIQSS